MIFFLVSFLSFLLLLINKPLPLHLHLHLHLHFHLPSWVSEMGLLSVLLCQELLYHYIQWLESYKLVSTQILKLSSRMFTRKLKIENVGKEEEEEVAAEAEMTVLDLPELALEMILDSLTPAGLLNMASVCTTTRKMCRSDHLWERHFREKWGRIMGRAARREWESYSASQNDCRKNGGLVRSSGLLESLSCVWPCSWFVPKRAETHLLPDDSVSSVMAWYLGLERGKFWFPAQVYNRENGHVGFMLSCYDAELSYDYQTDTFHARYPPHGQRPMNVEEGVQWERLRAPPVDTPAHALHISDCLNELQPGDHIEIQWRRNKKSPYGWWYGVVGHLESCDGEEHHCRCYNSDTVILEFNQYSPGSRWRRTHIDRKDHREEGNESDGFYGGIRKLYDKDEITMWRRLWPTEVLE